MDAAEWIKPHHLIELLSVGTWVGQAADMLNSLSPAEREQLAQRVGRLELLLAGQGSQPSICALGGPLVGLYETLPPDQREQLDQRLRSLQQQTLEQIERPPSPLLLGVVCVTMAIEDGPAGPRLTFGDQPEGATRPGLAAHASLVGRLQRTLRRYASLPDSDRAALIQYAAGIGIDLPADPQSDLLKLLAALARLGQADPLGRADVEPVTVVASHAELCGWCGKQLVTLFDFDLGSPQLSLFEDNPPDTRLSFLAPGWSRLRIAMCDRCTLFGTIFTEVDGEGVSHWSDVNARPEYIGTEEHGWHFPPRCLVLGPRRRSPSEVEEGIVSQIGGRPMWVQGNSHPRCPKCDRWMVFIGQVETSEARGGRGEGVTYAFLCQDCGMAATTYEQT